MYIQKRNGVWYARGKARSIMIAEFERKHIMRLPDTVVLPSVWVAKDKLTEGL